MEHHKQSNVNSCFKACPFFNHSFIAFDVTNVTKLDNNVYTWQEEGGGVGEAELNQWQQSQKISYIYQDC